MNLTEPINIHEAAREISERALDDIEYEGFTLREWIDVIKEFGSLLPDKKRRDIEEQHRALDHAEIQARADFANEMQRINRKRELLEEIWRRMYETD